MSTLYGTHISGVINQSFTLHNNVVRPSDQREVLPQK